MRKKAVWLVLAAVAVIVAAVGIAFLIQANSRVEIPESAVHPAATPSPDATSDSSTAGEPVGLEIDWDELWAINDEIYAWIDIPGTEMSFPVLQRPEDDNFYLRHSITGEYSSAGSIYTEATYNSTTFEDPVTILYGHNMRDDSTFFSTLEQYVSQLDLTQDAVIDIYTPDAKRTYRIFAGVSHDNLHILYYNDFTDEKTYNSFFDNIVSTRDLQANVNPDLCPVYGDRVIILSTCLISNRLNRYLVLGVLTDETPLAQS